MVTGSSWTTAGHARRRVRRHVEGDGPLRGDRRGRGDLRRVLRRQDDAALGDDDPRAEARRRRPDGRAAHPEHVLDGRPGARDQPRHLPRARPDRRAAGRREHAGGARRARRASSTSPSLNLLPLALLVVFTVRKVPPFLAILGSALFAGILACFTQWTVGEGVRGRARASGRSRPASRAIYGAMATGFVSKSGNPAIDQLFSRGGMASLLTTVWLVLGGAVVRGDHGARRLPRAAAAAGRGARADARTADPRRQRRAASG